MKKKNVLFAAGGTGGHLFPAMAVAEKLAESYGNMVEVFFIGTETRIESRKVPEAGYGYTPMPITGFPGLNPKMLAFPFKLLKSISIAKKLIRDKAIDGVVCAGAYISLPPGLAASSLKKKLFLMESNVNLGKANKMLLSKADKIFTTFDETENYIEKQSRNKISHTGNPVRGAILSLPAKEEACTKLGLPAEGLNVLIMGGSLGARSINNAVAGMIEKLAALKVNFLWQTGASFSYDKELPANITKVEFIDDMASAYAACGLVVGRSGATTVAELAVAGKASVLIPLPSASNNEQFHNAEAMQKAGAAKMVADAELNDKLFDTMFGLMLDDNKRVEMSIAAKKLARPGAAKEIAEQIMKAL